MTTSGEGLIVRPDTSDAAAYRQIWIDRIYDVPCPVEPTVILDLGAYTGLSARWFLGRYPKAKVIAVEPYAPSAAILVRNAPGAEAHQAAVRRNRGSGVVALRRPVGDGDWAVSFWRGGAFVGQALAVTVEDVLKGRRPEIVKVDIEGAERDLFAGDVAWLARTRLLLVELHDRHVPGCKQALRDALRRTGRRYQWVDRGGENVAVTLEAD